jgi:Co/Zn/Cd efflux system component
VHVTADAAASVLAILALAGGWLCGWSWLDPVMGIVGAVVVALWARSLIAQTSKVLHRDSSLCLSACLGGRRAWV